MLRILIPKKMGAGTRITWSHKKLIASALFVSEYASNSSIGFLADEGKDHITTQMEWVEEKFTFSTAYTHASNGNTDNSADIDDTQLLG